MVDTARLHSLLDRLAALERYRSMSSFMPDSKIAVRVSYGNGPIETREMTSDDLEQEIAAHKRAIAEARAAS